MSRCSCGTQRKSNKYTIKLQERNNNNGKTRQIRMEGGGTDLKILLFETKLLFILSLFLLTLTNIDF